MVLLESNSHIWPVAVNRAAFWNDGKSCHFETIACLGPRYLGRDVAELCTRSGPEILYCCNGRWDSGLQGEFGWRVVFIIDVALDAGNG